MTVAAAWIREFKNTQELVFVSDSRLSGDGRTVDASPKILMLPRSDCAIVFAGYTGDAYPLMHHVAFAIDAHRGLASRTLDLVEFKPHLLKVLDEAVKSIETVIPELKRPDVAFLFGGFSWLRREFRLWRIVYDGHLERFQAYETPHAQTNVMAKTVFFGTDTHSGVEPNYFLGQVQFAGDQADTARQRFRDLLGSRLRFEAASLAATRLDYEPFEVVRDMLRDPGRAHTIGGAPQMLKVYQHMNTAPFAVYWPRRDGGTPHIAGRPLLGYERIDRWYFDPDTLRSWNPNYTKEDDAAVASEESR